MRRDDLVAILVAVLALGGACVDADDERAVDQGDATSLDDVAVSDAELGHDAEGDLETEPRDDTALDTPQEDTNPYEVPPYSSACELPTTDYVLVEPVLLPECHVQMEGWDVRDQYWVMSSENDLSRLLTDGACDPRVGGDIADVHAALVALGVDFETQSIVLTMSFAQNVRLGDGATVVSGSDVLLRYDLVDPYGACSEPVVYPTGESVGVASVVPAGSTVHYCVRFARACW